MSEDATLDEFSEFSESKASNESSLAKRWDMNQADEIMEITRGASPRPKGDPELFGGDIPWIKIGDVDVKSQKYTGETEDTVTEKGAEKSKLVDSGTLLVSNSGTCGYPMFAGTRSCVHDGWLILRDYENDLNPHYLYEYISWQQNYLKSLAPGSTQINLNTSRFGVLEIAIPPLSEQRKIATVLHTVDQAIQKTEEIINQTKRVKCGLLDDLFLDGYYNHESYENIRIGAFIYSKPAEWEIETIVSSKEGENGLRRGPFGGMLKKEIFVDSGYKVYQQQNVIYDEFDYGDYYITKEKYRDMERFSVEEDDLLISCSGTLGKVAKVPSEYEQGVINQALLKFSVNDDLFNVNYMKYFLESKVGQRQLVLSSRGSAMKNMAPMEFVRSSKVFRPSKKEQNKIAESLSAMDDKISSEKNKKDRLQRLKRALMQDLLSGEVRTTDVNIDVPQEVAQHG
ncbi:restriction endonuclease subunit S [Haloquadratum walsbyi]|jgi:type I restriction enzyme S subunit|uniref:Type I site-specific deoxyribonuclease subunit RmeS n=1 Tax=Haloquadratum walsbyi (strain DSM 16854 / JCM 12705 / C23) TaxID=768065 RepID=G0LL16_HALWC|nr:restriction endonuclease subunit S [Haloquadratum walsbyi]CCC40456.1 type I site-specific deoxyribonuclease subunit RmeS [Haloquadratum walsbyi C23]